MNEKILTVGPQVLADGAVVAQRGGKSGEGITQSLHGRYYEQLYRGNLFSIGMTITPLTANPVTFAAATTPILGEYNPATSPDNLIMLQAALSIAANTLTSPVLPGLFGWAG